MLLKILTKRRKDSNTQESNTNINNASVHRAKSSWQRHHCGNVLSCFNNKKHPAQYRNTAVEVCFCDCKFSAFYYTIRHCHWLWIEGKKAQLESYGHFVNENEQHLTTESKVSNLHSAGSQVALTTEGTSASCKQCVMSIFHLPPQHPSGSQLEGRMQQNAGTAAFPTEKRHFSGLLSSTGPR